MRRTWPTAVRGADPRRALQLGAAGLLVFLGILVPTTAAPAQSTSSPSSKTPHAVAESVLITSADLPGWTPTQTGTPLGAATEISDCDPAPAVAALLRTSSDSASNLTGFDSGTAEAGVRSAIGSAAWDPPAAATAETGFAAVDSATFRSCYSSVVREAGEEFGESYSITWSQLANPRLGDESSEWQASLSGGGSLGASQSFGTFVFVRVGHILGMVSLATTTSVPASGIRPFTPHEVAHYTGLVVERMKDATRTQPTRSQACLRSGVPDPSAPILTTAQVDDVVGSKAAFRGESTGATSVCTWAIQETRNSRTPEKLEIVEWRVTIDGPLSSATAAYKAYLETQKSAALAVLIPDFGDHAAQLDTEPSSLIVQAGTYFFQISSSASPSSTDSMILSALATLVLARLHLASQSEPSPILPASTDWAGPKFCRSNYDQPFLAVFRGVASCGQRYTSSTSNTSQSGQGPIWYREGDKPDGRKLVEFDSTGFQCVEYADRYFYYMTGKSKGVRAGVWTDGGDLATQLYYTYKKSIPSLGLVPLLPEDVPGGTTRYNQSLRVGDIISMWSSGDSTGHVGVVDRVQVTKEGNGMYSGTITVVNENAQHGVTVLTVDTSVLRFRNGGFTTFQWLTGLPTS